MTEACVNCKHSKKEHFGGGKRPCVKDFTPKDKYGEFCKCDKFEGVGDREERNQATREEVFMFVLGLILGYTAHASIVG